MCFNIVLILFVDKKCLTMNENPGVAYFSRQSR